MEDNLRWKTTFDGNDLRWKMTFDGRRPLMEDDFRWKTTFDGGWPLMCSSSIFPAQTIDHSVLFLLVSLESVVDMEFHKPSKSVKGIQ